MPGGMPLTHQRASDAIPNGETEGAEFLVWWETLAGLNQGMAGPPTWKRLKEITDVASKRDVFDSYASTYARKNTGM